MTAFPSIRNEGGLLGVDLLDQLLAADLPGQKPSDFGLESRRSLTDEAAALFADARALWGVFQNRRARLKEGDPATTVTRDWVVSFLGLLGYELRYNQKAYEVDGLSFAISHRAGDGEDAPPVHIVGAGQPLGRVAASGRPRLAPHSLVQEYLNRTDHVWGLVTNGLTLRLLRDSTFIRRQAYVEIDLQLLLEGQHFQDFMALYRLLHRTRLPRGLDNARDCLLEKYHAHSEEQGGRVREHLREGVEKCLALLANGFLRHPANHELRQRVSRSHTGNERITPDDLYRQLLRLVYRFLFLLVSEDRGLLSQSPLYREHYGVGRLRRLVDQRGASPDHDDLWQSLRVLWRVLADERFARFLDLAPLNGELFSPQDLDYVTISNHDLLGAFWHLAWYQESHSSARRVNYAALDVEELGSVYESLLEFHPVVEEDTAQRPFFQLLAGFERKATGSYYTPPQLVAELVKSALEPVLADRLAARPKEPENAILSIRVCDPACGSGHFLLAAARRLGKELARVRSGEEEPAPEQVREAVRDVISHCVYGVDKNPLAVDLCRVALWLESHTGNKPLTFLDHRIRLGDSLIGVFDLETLAKGIPDEAFKPLEGDDKATARALAKRNRQEKGGQNLEMFGTSQGSSLADFTLDSREIDAIADDSPDAIRRKKQLFERSHDNPAWQRQQEACDLWTAAFFQPMVPDVPAISSGDVADHLAGRVINVSLKALALEISVRQRFFHWPLEFPGVFAEGGFDVILSNPPWEQVEVSEQEFFASRNAQISRAPTKADRSLLIEALRETNPDLYLEFSQAIRKFNADRTFLSQSGRFRLTGRGRINTYSVFAELSRDLTAPAGRSGVVIPTGIAFADTTRLFFEDLIRKENLVSLFSFFEIRQMFPATDSRDPFCLFTMCGSSLVMHSTPEFVFNAKSVGDIYNAEKRFTLSVDDIKLLNPNTRTCPIFQSRRDAELTKAIYRRVGILVRENNGARDENPWGIKFSQGLFNMAGGSKHFQAAEVLKQKAYRLDGNVFLGSHDRYLPLYEAKMLHQFDHRWSTYEDSHQSRYVTADEKCKSSFLVQPRYWVLETTVESAIPEEPAYQSFSWFLGWRDVCRSTDTRTLISSACPRTAVGDKFLLAFSAQPAILRLILLGSFNSFVCDFVTRQKLGGTALKYFIIKQIPVIPPAKFSEVIAFLSSGETTRWFAQRILELTYTAHDLAPLARDCGYDGPSFLWNDDRRFEIRCELDAAFFHLYLPSTNSGQWRQAPGETPEELSELDECFQSPRGAVEFIFDQFPLVRQRDEAAYGHYRTKDRVLEIYDDMLKAQRTGRPYQTTLNPSPGTQNK